MDLSFLVNDLISYVVINLIVYVLRSVRKAHKASDKNLPAEKKTPKEKLHRQFLFWLFGLLLSTIVFFAIKETASPFAFVLIKVLAGFAIFFSLIFTWGAFDAAFAFYPSDDDGSNSLPDNTADHSGDDS